LKAIHNLIVISSTSPYIHYKGCD